MPDQNTPSPLYSRPAFGFDVDIKHPGSILYIPPPQFCVDTKHPSITEDRRRTVQGWRRMLCKPVESRPKGRPEPVPKILQSGMQKCRQCDRLFTNQNDLENHVKTNTMSSCPVPQCEGRGFRDRADLAHHLHTMHYKNIMCTPVCCRSVTNVDASPTKGLDAPVNSSAARRTSTTSGNHPPSSTLPHSISLAGDREGKVYPLIVPHIGTGSRGFLSRDSPSKGRHDTAQQVENPPPPKRRRPNYQVTHANAAHTSISPDSKYVDWNDFLGLNIQTTDVEEARSFILPPMADPPGAPSMTSGWKTPEPNAAHSSTPPVSLRTAGIPFKRQRSPTTTTNEARSSNRPVTPHPPVSAIKRQKTQPAAPTMDARCSSSSDTTNLVEYENILAWVQTCPGILSEDKAKQDVVPDDVNVVVILQKKLDACRQQLELMKGERTAERKQWDDEKEGWEAEKSRRRAELYRLDHDRRRTLDFWAEDLRLWDVDRVEWKVDRAAWERDRGVWTSDRVAWAKDRKAWEVDRKDWQKERDEWVEDRDAWEAEREGWDTDREEWEAHMEECETHIEECEREKEEWLAREDELLAEIARYKEDREKEREDWRAREDELLAEIAMHKEEGRTARTQP